MLLGIDLGTGSVKTALFAEDGTPMREASRTYSVNAPRPTWAESDPNEWWAAVVSAVRETCLGYELEIRAIGLSGQMHSVVLCNSTGKAIRHAILWADGRSTAELKNLRHLAPDILEPLGNPIVVGMSAPTLMWLKTNEQHTYKQARFALQPKDWLACQLTEIVQTDHSDASATLLYDLAREDWHQPMLETLGLDPNLFPTIKNSTAFAGTLTTNASASIGLPAGLPVFVGAGDTAAAMLGSGLTSTRSIQLTIGTGAQLVALRETAHPDPNRRTHLFHTAFGPKWYAMAAMQNAGLALERVRQWLGLSWQDAYQLGFSAPIGADGLRFYPYLTGERSPHNNPELRGAWCGLSLTHESKHIMRSAFEGVAYSIRDGLNALKETGDATLELRIAGGGTLQPEWRQLLADVLNRPLVAVETSNASVRGAALLAGLGLGTIQANKLEHFAPDTQKIALPNPHNSAIYDEGYQRYIAAFEKVAALC
jgi:xylulokinase